MKLQKDFENELCKKDDEGKKLLDWRISWDSNRENHFQFMNKQLSEKKIPDLLINCDGYNPVTRVLSSWLRPEWIVGSALDKDCRKDLELGDRAGTTLSSR